MMDGTSGKGKDGRKEEGTVQICGEDRGGKSTPRGQRWKEHAESEEKTRLGVMPAGIVFESPPIPVYCKCFRG